MSRPSWRDLSLKVRLALGAALLGAGTLVTAATLYLGMQSVAARLETALAAEARMARYSALSTQAGTFLVVATEAVQSGLPRDSRVDRIAPVTDQLRRTFVLLRQDVEDAVSDARALGIDEQSRFGTQSLGLARMEAALDAVERGLSIDTTDRARLRAHIDSFTSNVDPLLSQAVNTEVIFRNDILAGIAALRQRLTLLAVVIGGLTVLAVAVFYLGLVRPQFRRLDRLRDAAQQIGQADFAVELPAERGDEIGQLYRETNRMAAALSTREAAVQAEADRLTQTVADRTAELRTANAKLAEIDENRRRFFADVSHELRTPLTVISMEAQIGRQTGGATGEAFATIETRAHRLHRRIDDLLRVARSETGQLALDPQPVALGDLIDSVVVEVQAETDAAGLDLGVAEPDPARLTCDPNWLRQVLVGLIRNALRHARQGRTLALRADHAEGWVEIAVTDNGPGIPAAKQAQIFDRFVQGGEGGQGFGIGLALAQWVIEAHGGTLTLVSPVPRPEALGDAPGTKIVVRLPGAPD